MRAEKPRNHAVLEMRGFLRGAPTTSRLAAEAKAVYSMGKDAAELSNPEAKVIKSLESSDNSPSC
jgi:hypothetical protein